MTPKKASDRNGERARFVYFRIKLILEVNMQRIKNGFNSFSSKFLLKQKARVA